MRYGAVSAARFVERPNRFIAFVEQDGQLLRCHVKNTGRCRELLVPGAEVWLEHSDNPNRRTAYDLIAVNKQGRLINMDSQAPNHVAAEYLPSLLPEGSVLRAELTHGDSRFDFAADAPSGRMLIEVKGVTLERDNMVYFPDAPTQRGVKHVKGLTAYAKSGGRAMLLFVVQMSDVTAFRPNRATDPAFADALLEAQRAGVELRAVTCRVRPDSMTAAEEIAVQLL